MESVEYDPDQSVASAGRPRSCAPDGCCRSAEKVEGIDNIPALPHSSDRLCLRHNGFKHLIETFVPVLGNSELSTCSVESFAQRLVVSDLVDFDPAEQDRLEQYGTSREPAVYSSDTDSRPTCDLIERKRESFSCERLTCDGQHLVPVTASVGTQRSLGRSLPVAHSIMLTPGRIELACTIARR